MKSFVLVLALAALSVTPDFDSAVLVISGASSIEDLDESTLEHFRALTLRPLNLNTAGRSRLLSSGLLNAFQVASLLDWRERSGAVLSYSELGLTDGFTPEYAGALSLFTTLETTDAPGTLHGRKLHNDLMLRASAKENDGRAYAAGLRYKASLGGLAELNWATRTTYSEPELKLGTVSGALYGRRWLGKLVLGHFNARFGQGLALWSGFSLQHYGSVNSFRRNGTGFSPTGSFSPSHCGVAADFDLGRWNAGVAYSIPDRKPMATVSWSGRRLTAGLSASDKTVSADFKLGLKNLGLYGEAAWNDGPAAVAGVVWVPSYGSKYGLRCSWIKGVPEAAAGASTRAFEAVTALSTEQFRLMLKYAPEFTAGPFTIGPSLRLAARRKDAWRLEARGELHLRAGAWAVNSRLDVVRCNDLSWLLNAEAGRAGEKLRIWARWTLFCVDNWDERIYVYERDAPGNFNVPAYYGRGYALSLTGTWKPSRRHAVHCRISYVEYPWMTTEKPSKAEVKLQYNFSL